jgi:uncharacterized protein
MQFIVIARDYKDGGLEKRLAVRDQHIKMGDQMKANGNYIMGVALLDDSDKMIGSVMILDYPSRKELDEWLKIEPYVVNNVWEKIQITPCKIGPTFLK